LSQSVNVSIANERFSMPGGPRPGEAVEVHQPREHRVALHGVEQVRITIHVTPQAVRCGKERMRRNDKTALPPLEGGEIIERPHVIRSSREIEKQNVSPLNRALDAANQDDAAIG